MIRSQSVTAAVLVGGRSVRMGSDKASLLVGGLPLAGHAALGLGACAELLLCGGEVVGMSGRVVGDREPNAGPLGGLVAALEATRTSLLLAAACDMPSISTELVDLLLDRLDASPAAAAALCRSSRGLEPFPLALRVTAARPCLAAALGQRRLRLTDALAALDPLLVAEPEWAAIDPNGASFVNWNTPDEIRQQPPPPTRIAAR